MLVDPTRLNSEFAHEHRLTVGIYTGTFRLQDHLSKEWCVNFPIYGVADSIKQILEHYKDWLSDPDNQSVLFVVEINKKDCSPKGGWRWCRWGEYIGIQEPTREYLYDEPVIESVVVYNIFTVR